MGYATQANLPLSSETIARTLKVICREAEGEDPRIAREYLKVGAAIAVAVCASLRGPEVFQLDLAGLRANISRGRDGMMPHNPLKAGTNLSKVPYVLIVLIGKFKGETGTRQHMLSLASSTRSGIALRWWIEELIKIREEEGCTHGPAFGDSNGAVAFLFEYDGILHHFLGIVQQEHPDLIAENDDVRINYSFFRLF